MNQKRKVVLIVGGGAVGLSEALHAAMEQLDEAGIEYEIQEPHEMVIRASDIPPTIVPPLEVDSKPYPERNRKKGKGKRF
jgi:hypothetical protein